MHILSPMASLNRQYVWLDEGKITLFESWYVNGHCKFDLQYVLCNEEKDDSFQSMQMWKIWTAWNEGRVIVFFIVDFIVESCFGNWFKCVGRWGWYTLLFLSRKLLRYLSSFKFQVTQMNYMGVKDKTNLVKSPWSTIGKFMKGEPLCSAVCVCV